MSLPSELAGTAGLWFLLLVAALLARKPVEILATLSPARFAVAAQSLHVIEEWATGFAQVFPQLLGLRPWSDAFFLAFNFGWLTLWLAAVAGPRSWRSGYPARILLWFLALAALANFVVHPALALTVGGYFPGLVSSFPLGLAGMLLAKRLKVGA